MTKDMIKILYIDDYELDRELVKDALEKEHGGFRVTEASNKQEFETLLKNREVDVVLSDFNIAGFEGLQVLEIVRAHDPKIPVIIVTGTGSEEIAVMAMKQGVSDYVIKRPQHIRKLPQIILAAMEKKALRDQRQKDEIVLKESEKRLLESNQLMDAVLGHTHMMTVFLDSQFNFIWVNRAYADSCGYEPSFFPGQNHFELYPHEENQTIFQRVVDTGDPYFVEAKPFEFPDQPERGVTYWDWSLVPVKDKFGGVTALVFTLAEVTERIRGEKALRESRDRLQGVLASLDDAILLVDPATRLIIEINDATTRIFGYSHDELVGKESYFLHVDQRHYEQFGQAAMASYEDPGYYATEFEMRRKGGDVFSSEHFVRPVRNPDGRIRYVVSVVRDISTRKRDEEERVKLQAQLSNAMEMVHLGHWEYDVASDLFTFNDHFYKIYRTTARQIGGYTMSSAEYASRFVHPEDIPVIKEEIRKAIEATDPHFSRQLEHRILYFDGTLGHITVRFFIVKDAGGRTIKTYGVNQDITERKRMEDELLRSKKLESVGLLAGGIAHDFNNILSSILGFTELALGEVKKDTILEDSLQEVYAAGKRARDLVKQILAFARQTDVGLKPIRVDIIVQEVLKFIRASIPTTIEIKQNIESESLIMGSATQVHQILMNLCTNAAHAMEKEGGILEVTLKDIAIDNSENWKTLNLKHGNYLEIKVSDTGVGIAAAIMDSIFEPYFTTKDPGEGTGMGLAMVHGIVKGYGGGITFENNVGKGTVFTTYLPITEKSPEAKTYVSEALPHGTERILFVDDEPSITKSSSLILEGLGYKVTRRTSSIEALELIKAKANDFDLMITDMTMPKITGEKLTTELMQIRPDIPVILSSGYSNKISDERASELGIKALLMKPVSKCELANTVRKVLDGAKGSAQG